ncbi:alpha/beta hydrolase [Autumnicola psychrophila]|uniref:Alpha/beta hydrolase n=1 Tax=Autumnicola psychrophila TaxID=3075592 RepID=A0ABU3DRW1_9FLAO|nr:alpha/beta hydrolase [Zunongwangia sp. F225]MDT0686453.1 alpha/beta hydrolase [Zunongwangia sp. F225]
MKKLSILKHSLFCTFITMCSFSTGFAQDEVINLYDEAIPAAITSENYKEQPEIDTEGNLKRIRKVSNPTLSVFYPKERNGTAVLIFPGGGYGHLAVQAEGSKVAHWFNKIGITAFVLKYRLPSDEIMKEKSLAPLTDARQAIKKVRQNAEKYKIDPQKIGVIGFSAGGHLAASLSTRFAEDLYSEIAEVSARPNFSILIYPVISMLDAYTHFGSRENLLGTAPSEDVIQQFSNENLVTEQTPPTFLVHATDDQAVPVENSLVYYSALKERNVPVELHIYEKGGHGFGLGHDGTQQYWPATLEKWLQQHSYLKFSENSSKDLKKP